MNAILDSLDQRMRYQRDDMGALTAYAIRMCCEGGRWQMDRIGRQNRLAPVMTLGSFAILAMFTLLFGVEAQHVPMLACFVGMVAWMTIFYGQSGRLRWKQIRAVSLLRAARMTAWLAMLKRFALSGWGIVEQQIQTMINRLSIIATCLRSCSHIQLGLADFNLVAFRLLPPEAVHA